MIFFPLNGYCAEEEASSPESVEQSVIDAQAESGEARSIEEQVRKYSGGEFNEIIQDYDPQDMIKDAAKGNFKMDVPGLLNRAVQYIFKEIYLNIHILIKLIVLVVLCALL